MATSKNLLKCNYNLDTFPPPVLNPRLGCIDYVTQDCNKQSNRCKCYQLEIKHKAKTQTAIILAIP